MIKFEEYLVSKGYEQFAFSFDKGYYKPKSYVISTMVNLGHIYIHPDREDKIIIGLHEKNRPVTLISPRPKIRVKRFKTIREKQIEVIENQYYDDSMNIVLAKNDFEDIFKAMYDGSICFDFDLTQNSVKAE